MTCKTSEQVKIAREEVNVKVGQFWGVYRKLWVLELMWRCPAQTVAKFLCSGNFSCIQSITDASKLVTYPDRSRYM